MSSSVSLRFFEFGTTKVADVRIRLVDTHELIAIHRSNPVTVDLEPGVYGVYVSGDDYDTALRAFNVFDGQDVEIDLPVYPVGTMPPPPRTATEMPVLKDGLSAGKIAEALGAPTFDESATKKGTDDGPAYMDYRNDDGYIYTTRIQLQSDKVIKGAVGSVGVVILEDCGNNTWRAIGSPR